MHKKRLQAYTYDANGNMVSKVAEQYKEVGGEETARIGVLGESTPEVGSAQWYTYNGFGERTGAMVDDKTAAYTYNPEGLRVSKTVNGEMKTHILDGSNVIADVKDGSITKYNRGRVLISIEQDGTKGYYAFNMHGDVDALLEGTSQVASSRIYGVYGDLLRGDEKYGHFANPFGYSGEYTDAETGDIYLRARYYDPNTGRFTSEDTHWNIGNMIYGDKEYHEDETRIPNVSAIMQSSNLYSYCMNNPVMFTDPSGLRNVVVVVGADAASNNNTFNSNADTFIRDNPNDTIVKLYAWDYSSQEELLAAVGNVFGNAGLDALVIESHAMTTALIVTSSYYIDRKADWSNVKFNAGANIRLTGCNAGGHDGKKQTNSVAQYISNGTGATVWAYTNNTSQKSMYGGTYQKPVRMSSGQKLEEYYTTYTPIYGPLPW